MIQPDDEVTRKASYASVTENMSRMRSGRPGALHWGWHWWLWPERTLVGTKAQRAQLRPRSGGLQGQTELCDHGVAASGSSEFPITGRFEASHKDQPASTALELLWVLRFELMKIL